MTPFRPQKIYLERSVKDFVNTHKILGRAGNIPVEIIDHRRDLIEKIKLEPDPIGAGKRYLLLAHDKGRSFKSFPETADYLSCDYYTLHLAEGCNLECSYCILQTYLTNPLLTVYVNAEEMLARLQDFLNQNPDQFFRIGTGQLADSLSLDPLTGCSEILVPFFAKQKNAVLELKTKSVTIERLLTLDPEEKTIVSWSMNSGKIQREEEHKCASLEERLIAARRVIESGYRVGFHFDPIIDYEGWEGDYQKSLSVVFENIPASKIAWISLGSLRFMPELKKVMQARFPKSTLASAEWTTGEDGKMRYEKARRIEIYRKMSDWIKAFAPGVTIYLTMESPEVWHYVFGGEYSKESVCDLLDRAGKGQGTVTV